MKKIFIPMLVVIALLFALSTNAFAATNIKVYIDGTQVSFDTQPRIESGTTLVPMRSIFEALGASVNWNASTKTVTGTKDGTTVKIELGDYYGTVNGDYVSFDVPAKQVNGRILVPLRFVSESFDCNVSWDSAAQKITITSIEKKIYGIGETAPIVHDGQTVGTLTINSVTTTDARNEYSDKTPAQVLIINYTYTNAQNEEMYIFSSHFQVLDSGNKICSTYPTVDLIYPQKTPNGASCTAEESFGTIVNSNQITLIYKYNMFDSKPTITFSLPIN